MCSFKQTKDNLCGNSLLKVHERNSEKIKMKKSPSQKTTTTTVNKQIQLYQIRPLCLNTLCFI